MAMGERIRFSGSQHSVSEHGGWRAGPVRYAVLRVTRCTTNYCTQSNRREKLCVSRLFSQTVSFDYCTRDEKSLYVRGNDAASFQRIPQRLLPRALRRRRRWCCGPKNTMVEIQRIDVPGYGR